MPDDDIENLEELFYQERTEDHLEEGLVVRESETHLLLRTHEYLVNQHRTDEQEYLLEYIEAELEYREVDDDEKAVQNHMPPSDVGMDYDWRENAKKV